MSKGFFKYDEKTNREWVEIDLKPDTPFSRASFQDYAAWANRSPHDWLIDGLEYWMKECDRQGAHGQYVHVPAPKPVISRWRVRLSEWLYGLADKISSKPEV